MPDTSPVRIDKGRKYAANPRTITDEQRNLLRKHLETLGDLSGVIYCMKNKAFVGGNQRSEIMDGCEIEIVERFDKPTANKTTAHGFITFGGEKFAYREVAFSKKEFKQACIVANSNGGVWDWDVLAGDDWADLPLEEWGLELLMSIDILDEDFELNEPQFSKDPSTDGGEAKNKCPSCGYVF